MARFAALANSLARVEQQSTLHLFAACRVTLVTVLHQNRPDFLLKKSQALRSGLSSKNSSPNSQKAEAGKCCGTMAEWLYHDCAHPIIRAHPYNTSCRRNKGTSPQQKNMISPCLVKTEFLLPRCRGHQSGESHDRRSGR